jgi:hypothetical protein
VLTLFTAAAAVLLCVFIVPVASVISIRPLFAAVTVKVTVTIPVILTLAVTLRRSTSRTGSLGSGTCLLLMRGRGPRRVVYLVATRPQVMEAGVRQTLTHCLGTCWRVDRHLRDRLHGTIYHTRATG